MAIIEPANQEAISSSYEKKYSAPLRLWHWLSALVMTGSLLTVLINSTLLDREPAIKMMRTELQAQHLTVTDSQVKSIVHEQRDSVWALHIYLGYFLAGLLLFRIVLEFLEVADQKFLRKIKAAYNNFHTTRRNREVAQHELTVKIIYAVFYVLLIIMAVTGLCLAFEDDVPALKASTLYAKYMAFACTLSCFL